MPISISNKSRIYAGKLCSHLRENKFETSAKLLSGFVLENCPDTDERLLYRTCSILRKIITGAVKKGLPGDCSPVRVLEKMLEFDRDRFYSEVCRAETVLLENDYYRSSDSRTRDMIRKDMLSFCRLHRLPPAGAASLFASDGKCMHRKKRGFLPYINHDHMSALPVPPLPVYIFIEENGIDRTEKRIRYFPVLFPDSPLRLVILPRPCRELIGADESETLSKAGRIKDKLAEKYKNRIDIILAEREYDPASGTFCCQGSVFRLLYRALLREEQSGGAGELLYLVDPDAEIRPDCPDLLLRTALHKNSRTVFADGAECGGNIVIRAEKKYYIPERHTLFSFISRKGAKKKSAKYAGGDAPGICIIKRAAFMSAYLKYGDDMPGVDSSLSCVAYVKKECSPASGLRAMYERGENPLGDFNGICPGAPSGVYQIPAAAAFTAVRALYSASLIPTRFTFMLRRAAARIADRIKYGKQAVSHRVRTPGYALLFFVHASVSVIFAGTLYALFHGGPAAFLSLLFFISPAFTAVLSIETGGKRKRLYPKSLGFHAKRSFTVYKNMLDCRSVRICEGERRAPYESLFSPGDLGLSLAAALAYHDLDIISLAGTYSIISELLDMLSSLTTCGGLYYSGYRLSDRSAAAGASVSGVNNALLFTCLIALKEGLDDLLPEGDALIKKCENIINSADLRSLYEPFCGVSGHRMLSYILSGGSKEAGREFAPAACIDTGGAEKTGYGTLDEIALPALFLPLFPFSSRARSVRRYLRINRRYSCGGMWGFSFCSSPDTDCDGEHIIRPGEGIPGLALNGSEKPRIYTPYGCFLSLRFAPRRALIALAKYRSHGSAGEGGFFDSVITGADNNHLSARAVRCYTLHNICTSVISLSNYRNGNIFVRRFCRSELVRPYLYRLREISLFKTGNTAARIAAEQESKSPLPSVQRAVPSIRLITNGIISLAASDRGHIYLFSKRRPLTAYPFDKYDMEDISRSFSVSCCADGRVSDPLGGRMIADQTGVLYIKNESGITSFLKFTLDERSGKCRISLIVKGTFDDIGVSFSFICPYGAKPDGDSLVCKGEGFSFSARCVCEDGEAPEQYTVGQVWVSDVFSQSSPGLFSFEIELDYREEEEESFSRPLDAREKLGSPDCGGLLQEAILAGLYLCAGKEREGADLDPERFRELFGSPVICAFTGESVTNPGIISSISSFCRRLREAGEDILFVLCTSLERSDPEIGRIAGERDIVIDPDGECAELLRGLSVVCFEKEDLILPDPFLCGILSVGRGFARDRYEDLYCLTSPGARGVSQSGEGGSDRSPVFFACGKRLSALCRYDRLPEICFEGVRIACKLRVYLDFDGVKRDLIYPSFIEKKGDTIIVFKRTIGGETVYCEMFADEELSAIVIRVISPVGGAGIDLIPADGQSDPRSIRKSAVDNAVFYHGICRGKLEECRPYLLKREISQGEYVFVIGSMADKEQNYYLAAEKYSFPSGCESPVPPAYALRLISACPEADRMISRRQGAPVYGGLKLTGQSVCLFPMIALTDPPALCNLIRQSLLSEELSGEERIMISAAVASYYEFTGDLSFLRENIAGRESVYSFCCRALEDYAPEREAERFIRSVVRLLYRPLCAAVGDSVTDLTGDEDHIFPGDCTDEHGASVVCEGLLRLLSGEIEEGTRLLFGNISEICKKTPAFISIFCQLFISKIIGIKGFEGGFSVTPALSGSCPSFKFRMKRGGSEFRIRASSHGAESFLIDGFEGENRLYFDGRAHTVEIIAPKTR